MNFLKDLQNKLQNIQPQQLLTLLLVLWVLYNILQPSLDSIADTVDNVADYITENPIAESVSKAVRNVVPTVKTTSTPLNRPIDGEYRATLINVYAPWCTHSKTLLPVWKKVEDFYSSDPLVDVVKIDAVANPEFAQQLGIRGYPTILLRTNGKLIEYNGDRSFTDITLFTNRYR